MLELINRPLIRLVMVGLPLLALQTTLLTEMRVADIVVQVMLLMAVAGGVAGGPERGALVGFTAGLLFDLVLTTPLGLTAFVYGVAGFLAGYINSLTADHPWWLSAIVVGVASALGTIAYPVVALMIGIDTVVGLDVFRVALVVSAVNTVLAIPMMPVMRWCLRIRRDAMILPPVESYAT